MKLLIIDNYDSFTYNLVQLIKQAGIQQFTIVKNDNILSLNNHFDKILISPGPGIAYEAGELMTYLQQNYQSASILGICLGQEAIVELFGGRHKKLDHPLHGYQNRVTIIHQHYIFKKLPTTLRIGHYHSWYVDEPTLPAGLKILVKDENNLIMGLTHKNYDVTGLLFHPESMMTEFGMEIIQNWIYGLK